MESTGIAIFQLSLIAMLPVLLSGALYFLNRRLDLTKIPYWVRQASIGILFGGLAVLGTECGIQIGGAVLNARDAAPLCAGLLFGAPAGILAGVIGGVERWFAVYWGAGAYTRLACSVSTVLAGLFAAALRKYMFEDKKPRWYYALAAGVIMEVVHMLMVFLTNMSDARTAFTFVRTCSLPMIAVNGLAVMLAAALLSVLSDDRRKAVRQELKNISQTFQRWLLACVTAGFLMTTLFTWTLQTGLAINEAHDLVELNLQDVCADVLDASNENLLRLTKRIAAEINADVDAGRTVDSDRLKALGETYDIPELNLIDEGGIITASTYASFLHYDMRGGKQSAEFLVLLRGATREYVQSYMPTSSNPDISRKYAGVRLKNGGFVQAAYDAARFQRDIDDTVIGVTRNRHVGENGCIIIADEDWKIVSDRHGREGQNLAVSGLHIDRENLAEGEPFTADVYGEPSYCAYVVEEGYYVVAAMPQSELLFSRDIAVYVTVFMEFVIFGMLFIVVYFLIKKLIVDNMRKVNRSLEQITGGNLDVVVDVRGNEEFASLSDDINETVLTLKRYIAEAAARIDQELEFAQTIQHSAIPTVFPPYPNRREFEIFACMDTAKEVGGDFYDFYFTAENKLGFLIADVSGKGIPAAMFMMTAKTIIKGYAESGRPVEEVFTMANEKLCENNEAGMFVTAWMGVLDLTTGMLEFANAGHNPPLVRHADGSFTYLKTKPGLMLAGLPGLSYKKNELQLSPGDEIYIYTDGVTEAADTANELYGEQRLLELLNTLHGLRAEEVCRAVKEDVMAFAGEAPQFDDITMLYLKYQGGTDL